MEKNSYLISSLLVLLCSCQSAMLTSSNETSSISYEDAQQVANLECDDSHVRYIDLPNGNPSQYNPVKNPMTGSTVNDHLSVDKVIPLGKIPGDKIGWINHVLMDDNKLFVRYFTNGDSHCAIFDMKGKFIAKLDYDGDIYDMTICRSEKEVLLHDRAKNQQRIYSYNGKLLRIEPIIGYSLPYFTGNVQMNEMITSGSRRERYLFLTNKQGDYISKVKSNGASVMKDNDQVFMHKLDTVWQITPDKAITRYVYRKKYENTSGLSFSNRFVITSWQPGFTFNTQEKDVDFDRYFDEGSSTYTMIADFKSNKSSFTCGSYFVPRTFWQFISNYHHDSYITNPISLNDGYFYSWVSPLEAKNFCANMTKSKSAALFDEMEMPKPEDVKMVHKLKLDDNPVLVIMKLDVENAGITEYINFYKKKGLTLTEQEVREKADQRQKMKDVIDKEIEKILDDDGPEILEIIVD